MARGSGAVVDLGAEGGDGLVERHDLLLFRAQATHAAFLGQTNLAALFSRLDEEDFLDARTLGDLLAQLGRGAAPAAPE